MTEIECKSLEECPWQQLHMDGHNFIVKCFKKKSTCEVLVSDFMFTWYEKLDAFGVIDRNARFNPSIETSVDRLLLHLVSLFDNTGHQNMSSAMEKMSAKFIVVMMSNTNLTIASESRLCGEPFSWEFNLLKRDDNVLSEQLMKPLMSMVVELSRRQQQLFWILADKDAQIADYKAEGFKIPIRYDYEEPFDETNFMLDMNRSEEFQKVVTATDGGLNHKLQSLYTAVMNARSRSEEENHSRMKNNSMAQQLNKGLKGAAGSEPDISSMKELELLRRQALQSRLAEEQTRKEIQSKNKKLKL